MKRAEEHVKSIIGRLGSITNLNGYRKDSVYHDWCAGMALSIANSCTIHDKVWGDREREYENITMSFKTKVLFRKADGKRIKNDRYIVLFYK